MNDEVEINKEPLASGTVDAPESTAAPQEAAQAAAVPALVSPKAPAFSGGGERRRFGGSRSGGRERGSRREPRERVRPEFDHKTLTVRRVARVVSGGRRFSFSVALVVGNRKGSVGVGLGKGADTALALEKATRDAKKHLIHAARTPSHSIAHEIAAKYSSARVVMFPAPRKGLIAGSAVRTVLELGGLTDVNAKILSGSKNKLNIARAAIKALLALRTAKVYESTNREKSSVLIS